jgi:hypothetical protein
MTLLTMSKWLRYLHDAGVVSYDVYSMTHGMLMHGRPPVYNQALAYVERTINEHPDHWIAFRAKQRLAGEEL